MHPPLWRRSKSGPRREHRRAPELWGSGVRRPCAGEVAVFEAIAVAPEGEDLGVVNEPVDHRRGGDLVAKISPQAPNGLMLVTISDARS
jgi:hypothetical protein